MSWSLVRLNERKAKKNRNFLVFGFMADFSEQFISWYATDKERNDWTVRGLWTDLYIFVWILFFFSLSLSFWSLELANKFVYWALGNDTK